MASKKQKVVHTQRDDDRDEEYRKKRERNNEAVIKSREKAKQKAQENRGRVNALRVKNQELESERKRLKDELKFLKGLFKDQVKANPDKANQLDLEKFLVEEDSDDENET